MKATEANINGFGGRKSLAEPTAYLSLQHSLNPALQTWMLKHLHLRVEEL